MFPLFINKQKNPKPQKKLHGCDDKLGGLSLHTAIISWFCSKASDCDTRYVFFPLQTNLIFGWKLSSYKTLFDSAETMVSLQLGIFNYEEVPPLIFKVYHCIIGISAIKCALTQQIERLQLVLEINQILEAPQLPKPDTLSHQKKDPKWNISHIPFWPSVSDLEWSVSEWTLHWEKCSHFNQICYLLITETFKQSP